MRTRFEEQRGVKIDEIVQEIASLKEFLKTKFAEIDRIEDEIMALEQDLKEIRNESYGEWLGEGMYEAHRARKEEE